MPNANTAHLARSCGPTTSGREAHPIKTGIETVIEIVTVIVT
jgi:hypothetical protein